MHKFCLILATVGRCIEVEKLLFSLKSQTYSKFRLIIVDQNLDSRLLPIINKYKKFIKIKHIKIQERGVSNARNVGLKYVLENDSIVAFPDDDCVYPRNTLEQVSLAFNKYSLDMLSGVNISLNAYNPYIFLKKPSPLNRFNIFKNAPTYVFFYSNKIIKKVGFFDVNFGPGSFNNPFYSAEDTDYSIRALNTKCKSLRFSGLKIAHPELAIKSDSDLHKCLGYGLSRMQLLKKHKYPKWFFFVNKIHPLYGLLKNLMNSKMRKYYFLQFISRSF